MDIVTLSAAKNYARSLAFQQGLVPMPGDPGTTPHIDPTTKHWMIGSTDTGVLAEGISPHIQNGNWFVGTQDTGVQAQGEEGKSAYEVAVENGFVGTVEDWLDSLHAQGVTQGELSTAISAHNNDDLSHGDIRAEIVAETVERNDAIIDLQQQIDNLSTTGGSVTIGDITSAVTNHNADPDSHQDIRNDIDQVQTGLQADIVTAIEAHDSDPESHEDIREELDQKLDIAQLKRTHTFWCNSKYDPSLIGIEPNGTDIAPFTTWGQVLARIEELDQQDTIVVNMFGDFSAEQVKIEGKRNIIIQAESGANVQITKIGSLWLNGQIENVVIKGLEVAGNTEITMEGGHMDYTNCNFVGVVHGGPYEGYEYNGDPHYNAGVKYEILGIFTGCHFYSDINMTRNNIIPTPDPTIQIEVAFDNCVMHKNSLGIQPLFTLAIPTMRIFVDNCENWATRCTYGISYDDSNTNYVPSPAIAFGGTEYAFYTDASYGENREQYEQIIGVEKYGYVSFGNGQARDNRTHVFSPFYIGVNTIFNSGVIQASKENSTILGILDTGGIITEQVRDIEDRQGFQKVIYDNDEFGQRTEPDLLKDSLNGISNEFVKRTLDPNDKFLMMEATIDGNGNKINGGLIMPDPFSEVPTSDGGVDIVVSDKDGNELHRWGKNAGEGGGSGTDINLINSDSITFTGENSSKQANVNVDSGAGLAVGSNGVTTAETHAIPTAENTAKLTDLPTNSELTDLLASKQDAAPSGYGFSRNDFTDALYSQLNGLPTGQALQTSLDGKVSLAGAQTINGNKTFSGSNNFTVSPTVPTVAVV